MDLDRMMIMRCELMWRSVPANKIMPSIDSKICTPRPRSVLTVSVFRRLPFATLFVIIKAKVQDQEANY